MHEIDTASPTARAGVSTQASDLSIQLLPLRNAESQTSTLPISAGRHAGVKAHEHLRKHCCRVAPFASWPTLAGTGE